MHRVFTALLFASGSLVAQEWHVSEGSQPTGRMHPITAWDSARSELMVFGGGTGTLGSEVLGDTWTWDQTTWERRFQVTPGPGPRAASAMIDDPIRQRIVLFGGSTPSPTTVLDDTWEWDGTSWNAIQTTTRPPARQGHSLVYDDARNVVLLHGGRDGSAGELDDLWEYDGNDWVQLTPTTTPPPRSFHGAAFDSARGVMVVAGGRPDGTWEWDGIDWSEISSAQSPIIARHALAYDPTLGVVGLGPPSSVPNSSSLTYRWDGSQWIQLMTLLQSRRRHAVTFDPTTQRVLAVGGTQPSVPAIVSSQRSSTISAFDGVLWNQLTEHPLFGTDWDGGYHAAADQFVVFGGRFDEFSGASVSNATYIRSGPTWERSVTGPNPPGRTFTSLAYDRAHERLVMFGGNSAAVVNPFNDTWTWDGTAWAQEFPTSSPSPRGNAGMAYDEHREVVVLHGGGLLTIESDTWEWDGQNWAKVSNSGPQLRLGNFVYDFHRRRFVCFGFSLTSVPATWEYDAQAATWHNLSGTTMPTLSFQDVGLCYDPIRGVTLLATEFDGTWSWDGTTWTQLTTDEPVYIQELYFDENRARTFGILDGAEAWEYRTDVAPTMLRYGPEACGASSLRNELFSYARLGHSVTFEITGGNQLWPGMLMFGDSNTDLDGTPLPIALDAVGVDGCWFAQNGNVTLAAPADAFGTTRFTFTTPNDPNCLATRFFVQGITVEPGLNPLGLAFSRGIDGTIGH